MVEGGRRRAVALRYDPAREPAPRVVARGEGELAERILAAAKAHGVPVWGDPALAVALARLDLEAVVPPEFFEVLAEVLAYVYRLNRQERPG